MAGGVVGQVKKVFVRSLDLLLGSVMTLKGKIKPVTSPSHLGFASIILSSVSDREAQVNIGDNWGDCCSNLD